MNFIDFDRAPRAGIVGACRVRRHLRPVTVHHELRPVAPRDGHDIVAAAHEHFAGLGLDVLLDRNRRRPERVLRLGRTSDLTMAAACMA